MKTILIIEDDATSTASLVARLEASDYEVLIARDAVNGAFMVIENNPALILLDISLPEGSGLALAKKLFSRPETRHTPIIFVTSDKDPQLREVAMNLRAAGLFDKPYDAEELLAIIRYTLGDTMTKPRTELNT